MTQQTTGDEAPRRKWRVDWANAIGGGVMLLPVLAALKVDVFNNYHFGLTISGEVAWAGVMAACGVAVFPGLTHICRRAQLDEFIIKTLRVATAACVFVTVMCAYFAYQDGRAKEMANRTGHGEGYASARQDEKDAREEAKQARAAANEIKEDGSVEDLAKDADTKQKAFDSRVANLFTQKLDCDQSKTCRKLRDELSAVRDRLGKARQKQAHLTRADEADAKMRRAQEAAKAGPVLAGSMDNENGLTVFFIGITAMTVLTGLLGEGVFGLLSKVRVPVEEPKPAKPSRVIKKAVEAPQPVAKRKSDMDEFLDAWTEEADGWTAASEFKKCMIAHWAQRHPGKKPPTDTALGTAMGKRYEKMKTKGQQHYMAGLKKLGAARQTA